MKVNVRRRVEVHRRLEHPIKGESTQHSSCTGKNTVTFMYSLTGVLLFFFFNVHIVLLRGRVERCRERERENSGTDRATPDMGLDPTDWEVTT